MLCGLKLPLHQSLVVQKPLMEMVPANVVVVSVVVVVVVAVLYFDVAVYAAVVLVAAWQQVPWLSKVEPEF
jgi:hypothetical protein